MTEADELEARRAGRPSVRVLLAAGLLLAEYLAISFAVDARSVLERGEAWAAIGHLGAIGPLLIVLGAAFLLVLAHAGARSGARLELRGWNAPALLVHVGLAAALGYVVWLVFGGVEPPRISPFAWLSLLGLLALGSAATLFQAFIGDWRWLGRTIVYAAPVGGGVALLAWLAGLWSAALWDSLSAGTFLAVSGLLRGVGFVLEIDFTARALDLDGFRIVVAPVCSGVEGIGLYVALMTGFLLHYRADLRFPRALLLLPVGVMVMWLANVARITALMLVGARVSESIAVGSFHSKAGWVLFCGITVAMALAAHASPQFSRAAAAGDVTEAPALPWVVPLMALLGVGLLTSTFAHGHDPLYAVAVLAATVALYRFRRSYWHILESPTAVSAALGVGVGLLWLAVPVLDDTPPPGEGWPLWLYGSWIVARVVGSVLVVPVCEELAFRGFLARWLTHREFVSVSYCQLSPTAIIASSVAFGLLHERWVLAILAGLVYALAARRSGKLSDAIVAHVASNAVIAAWVVATGRFEQW